MGALHATLFGAVPLDRFAAIPDTVLGPLARRSEAEWHRAPPGKWTPAQIVQHLAISVDGSSRVFQERRAKPAMRRRPRPLRQRLAHFLYLDVGWIPSGRRAPEVTEPAEHPDARVVERQLRDGVTRFVALARELLPARRADLFVRHPVFGDLTLPEWLRFHVRHRSPAARRRDALRRARAGAAAGPPGRPLREASRVR